MKCFQCAQEIVELPEENLARKSPDHAYAPAFVVEVLPGGPGGAEGPCRATVICWTCMHVIRPALWLSAEGWDAGKPAIPSQQLPLYAHDADDRDDVETYDPMTRHCDDYIDDPSSPEVLRKYLTFARAPAHGLLLPRPHPTLYADHDGRRVRVTMASRMGDVGITTDLSAETGYDLRVHVGQLSNLSEEP